MRNERQFPKDRGNGGGVSSMGLEDEDGFDARTARERGPLDDDDEDDRPRIPPKYQKAYEQSRAKLFAEQHHISNNGTNYHHVYELTDEHLPELEFLRYDNLFTARTANAYVTRPLPRPAKRHLFGDIWREGELMLLFADTGLGKSALAVQISAAIAGGEPIEPFAPTTGPQRVLYFDFELTDEQFADRYSDPEADTEYTEPLFPLNFIRCAPLEDAPMPEEFEDHHAFLIHSVAKMIRFSGARVVIVDNITWLSANTEHSAAAQRLMRMLGDLKNKLGLSILVIAHTPKMRRGMPIELNQLHGSKMLANFADNIVGMGRSSNGRDLRYLKPLKQRNTATRFDETCVPVFRLAKQGRILGLTFVDNEPEARHIEGYLRGAALTEAIREDKMQRAIEMSNAGDTVREIATRLGVGLATAWSYLNKKNEDRPSDVENSENAHFCSDAFGSGDVQPEHKSDFLHEKEVLDEFEQE